MPWNLPRRWSRERPVLVLVGRIESVNMVAMFGKLKLLVTVVYIWFIYCFCLLPFELWISPLFHPCVNIWLSFFLTSSLNFWIFRTILLSLQDWWTASLPRSRFLDVTQCVTSKKRLRGRVMDGLWWETFTVIPKRSIHFWTELFSPWVIRKTWR